MIVKEVICVLYFERCLGAAHPKHWSKKLKKQEKARKLIQNFAKERLFGVGYQTLVEEKQLLVTDKSCNK